MEKLYIVDGTAYLFRSYFAIRQMSNPKGQSTNALYGFIRSIQKLIRDFSPKHFIVIFDGPENSKSREEIYPDYKKNRKAIPEDLPQQMQWASDYCDLAGIAQLSLPMVEADDTMGSVAKWAEKLGCEIFLCSSDKDLCQLVSDKVFILNTYKDNLVLDSQKAKEIYGVPPRLMIDFLAIAGDSSDNVPGLHGFGPKTAAKLLEEFGSLEELLSHPEKVSGEKKQKTLREEAETARLSKRLVTIDTSVPFPKEEHFFRLGKTNEEALKKFHQEHNFSSLLKEMENPSPSSHESTNPLYELVDDENSLKKMIGKLKEAGEVCFDAETTDLHPLKAKLLGLGFCIKEKSAWYVPSNGKLGLHRILKELKPLFESPHMAFYGHNVKYDSHILLNYEINIRNISFDTILASYLLNSHSHRHSLDHLSMQYFNKEKIPIKSLIGSGKKQTSMEDVPIELLKEYCCEDVDYTFRLKNVLERELKERKLAPLLANIELPLMRVLLDMERHGVHLCKNRLLDLSKELRGDISILENEIYALSGETFNLNSPKQLSSILFEKLSIPPSKKKSTGHSTSAEVLEKLKDRYPIARKILEYRSLEKLRSTYVDSLPNDVLDSTNRIHCSFNQSVAATGRLSCQNPNLQNIPVRSREGRKIREAFLPEKKGWSFISADYSQIELRLLAHFSEDPNLLKAFRNNEDVHSYTASLVFGVPLEKVDKRMRFHAKAVNFGIIYGQQAFGLSKELNVSIKEAYSFIEKYFERYKHVRSFIENCKEISRKTGRASTITGRERIISEINSKNPVIRSAAERLAVNTPLQGTAADLIKLAMIEADKKIKQEKKIGFMILQVHDELIFEVPDFELLDFEHIIRNSMEKVFTLKVPLIVDIHIGKNWKEC